METGLLAVSVGATTTVSTQWNAMNPATLCAVPLPRYHREQTPMHMDVWTGPGRGRRWGRSLGGDRSVPEDKMASLPTPTWLSVHPLSDIPCDHFYKQSACESLLLALGETLPPSPNFRTPPFTFLT